MRRPPLILSILALLAAPAAADVAIYSHSFAVPSFARRILAHSNGELWITSNTGVYRYSRSGVQLARAGSYASMGLAEAPNGDVWVCNHPNSKIERYRSSGFHTQGVSLNHTWAQDVSLSPQGVLYAACFNGGALNAIERIAVNGDRLGEITYSTPVTSIAISGDRVCLLPRQGGQILSYSLDLQFQGTLNVPSSSPEQLWVDRYGRFYLMDSNAGTLEIRSPTGVLMGMIGPVVPGYSETYGNIGPTGVSTASDGSIFLVDQLHSRVLVLVPGAVPASRTSWGRVKALYR